MDALLRPRPGNKGQVVGMIPGPENLRNFPDKCRGYPTAMSADRMFALPKGYEFLSV